LTIDSGFGNILEAPTIPPFFLTQLDNPQSQRAAIKFIPAGPNADLQLSLWRRVKQLEHPNLLRIFETGRWAACRTGIVSMWSWSMPKKTFHRFSPSGLSPNPRFAICSDLFSMRSFFLHGKGLVSFADQTFQHSRHPPIS